MNNYHNDIEIFTGIIYAFIYQHLLRRYLSIPDSLIEKMENNCCFSWMLKITGFVSVSHITNKFMDEKTNQRISGQILNINKANERKKAQTNVNSGERTVKISTTPSEYTNRSENSMISNATPPSLFENSFEQNKNNEEIVLRWSQFLSILPFAGMDNFNSDIPMPTFIRNFRYIFSLYIYVYFLNIANEGGTYFRPIFFDLKSINRNEDLISKRYEIMLGSNLLISPVSNGNCTNMSLFFPEEKFYDFYTGNQINKEGEGYYTIFLKKARAFLDFFKDFVDLGVFHKCV